MSAQIIGMRSKQPDRLTEVERTARWLVETVRETGANGLVFAVTSGGQVIHEGVVGEASNDNKLLADAVRRLARKAT